MRLFPKVGRIFDMMAWLAGVMMLVAVIVLIWLAHPFWGTVIKAG